jgi:hypothetical protein
MVRRSCWNGLHNMPFARDNPLSLPIHAGFQLLNPAYSYPWKCRCPIRRLIVEGGSHAAPLISNCKQPVVFGCSRVASCPRVLCENSLSQSINAGFQLLNPAYIIPYPSRKLGLRSLSLFRGSTRHPKRKSAHWGVTVSAVYRENVTVRHSLRNQSITI